MLYWGSALGIYKCTRIIWYCWHSHWKCKLFCWWWWTLVMYKEMDWSDEWLLADQWRNAQNHELNSFDVFINQYRGSSQALCSHFEEKIAWKSLSLVFLFVMVMLDAVVCSALSLSHMKLLCAWNWSIILNEWSLEGDVSTKFENWQMNIKINSHILCI
jgi:hypothetical protein